MRTATVLAAATLLVSTFAVAAPVLAAESTTMVGGQAMYPSKNIVANAVNSADHTTLVAAVKAAGLAPTLEGKGPFTVFAPTNEAFNDLPPGTVDTLVKPENKAALVNILTYHVVPGDYTTGKLRSMIMHDHGVAMLKTVQAEALAVRMNGSSNMTVTDAKGDVADITIGDVRQSNGVIQVIDKVLTPK